MASHGEHRGSSKDPEPPKSRQEPKEFKDPRPAEPQLSEKSAELKARLDFLDKHRERLTDKRRESLDALRAKLDKLPEAERKNAEKLVKNYEEIVDRSLREQFAQELSQVLPFPVDQVSRIPKHEGGQWEQLMRNLTTGKTEKLSIESSTRDGTRVQIDEYDARRRVPIEHKSSEDVTATGRAKGEDAREFKIHDLQDQMERQARFARDWGLKYFEWQVDPLAVRSLVDTAYARLTPAERAKIRIVGGVPASAGTRRAGADNASPTAGLRRG
jgi:hypothetical protein